MAGVDLTQAEADALISMPKQPVADVSLVFPPPGDRISIELTSADKRENFHLDVSRSQIKLTKATYQTRSHQVVILMRLDLDGPPHRNPDGEEIPCPHLHLYREGYGDRWAIPAPIDRYPNVVDLFATCEAFVDHCNIAPLALQKGLFS